MKPGTHNLGRNASGQTAFARIGEHGVFIQIGPDRLTLNPDQAQLLKDILE